jgi:hypothetical protein
VNTFSTPRATVVALFLVAAGAAHAGSSVTASVAGDVAGKPCSQIAELSGLDTRIAEKAKLGVGSLRQYIWITRGIYALDMADTVARLDQQRSARTTCIADASSVASR